MMMRPQPSPPTSDAALAELRELIARHARPDLRTPVPGLLLSRVTSVAPDYSVAEPLLVVMAQGGKRLMLGDEVHEYRTGQCLVVSADVPVAGHFLDASAGTPALALGVVLRPAVLAPLLLHAPGAERVTATTSPAAAPVSALATSEASTDLLDAAVRLLRLLDHPADAPVLAPLLEREIHWRLLTGPHGPTIRQVSLADSVLAQVSRAIRWIRAHYAEPLRIADLARLAGMSPSAFHRRFRAVTALSPLQFQKRLRLQQARTLLLTAAGDVAAVGHQVGYDSPTQFNREYRRLFGAPPGRDATRLRANSLPAAESSYALP
ncbi:AraC family transcriptional regulator [Frankia sp. Ag45/Mut15]|uniref:AraC family transcriptional regulator n=1 Tax=Frankia umida TaxID=573489 RepID=A0ABT0JZA2_9ACTN|nr:AraC family transcriptional regulator [Frankia umida]MCK9876866.1 AraC family transcriptional regulator [Frankia umida]